MYFSLFSTFSYKKIEISVRKISFPFPDKNRKNHDCDWTRCAAASPFGAIVLVRMLVGFTTYPRKRIHISHLGRYRCVFVFSFVLLLVCSLFSFDALLTHYRGWYEWNNGPCTLSVLQGTFVRISLYVGPRSGSGVPQSPQMHVSGIGDCIPTCSWVILCIPTHLRQVLITLSMFSAKTIFLSPAFST